MTPGADDLCVFAVKRGNIENRIDVSYNHPKYIHLIAELKKHIEVIPFGELINSLAGGATPLRANKEQYCTSGIKFLRIQNITTQGFDFSDVKYISDEVNNNLLKRSQLSVGDLLMTITGRIGTSAVVTNDCLPANINQHIVRIRLKFAIEPEFAAAFLNSEIGTTLSNRAVTGTTRIALDYESLKNIPFPYITDKAKQKRLVSITQASLQEIKSMRQQADDLLANFDNWIAERCFLKKDTATKLCFAIKLKNLDGVIDAKRYRNIKQDYDNTIADVCEIIDEKIIAAKYGNQIIDWIRIDDLPNQPLDIETIRTLPANQVEGTFFAVQKGDILVARLGPTILNQKIVIVRNVERDTIASSEFLVLRCKDGYNAEAVMAVLKTPYYRDLMYSHSRGSTPSRYRLNREDMLKLPFPDIQDVQENIAEEAKAVRDQVVQLRAEAEQEWAAAKARFEKELLE